MRLILALAATLLTTPSLASDSEYTAAALTKCLRGYTSHTTRVTLSDDLKYALNTCAALYRIHRIVAMAEGATREQVDEDFRGGVAMLAEEIMGR